MKGPEGDKFTFSADMQAHQPGVLRSGAKLLGHGAMTGARESVKGPVRLMVSGTVLFGASWVIHPSHDYINTGYDQVEHYENAAEELGKINPQDSQLQNMTAGIQDREDKIRSTRGFEFDTKRAQVASFGQVASGLMAVSGGIWLGLRKKEDESSQEVLEDEAVSENPQPQRRRRLKFF